MLRRQAVRRRGSAEVEERSWGSRRGLVRRRSIVNVETSLTPICRSDDNPRDTPLGSFPRRAPSMKTVTTPAQVLHQRSRALTERELADIPWLHALDVQERSVAV